MRAPLAGLLLLVPLLAGCLEGQTPAATLAAPLSLPEVPEGATVETLPEGLRLVWADVELPFEEKVVLPQGTTLVRATAVGGAEDFVSVTMRHAGTERRRCNFASLDAWDAPVLGRASCSGVTAMDALPDAWLVRAGGLGLAKLTVHVDLLTTPHDGLLAQLDLSQLSMRQHTLLPTEVLEVPSFDGTPLRVEVTLPEGPGPWPTVLWSSPYSHDDRAGGDPAAWKYFVNDWAQRGYAVVAADVRGYGESGGCVEVWGPNEQKDQVFLVEWVAQQAWSDRRVGFYGQSYVATTPVEAAVFAPEALKAIVIVAPVTDAYSDWHFGGVPNGENLLSPVGYQTIGGGVTLPPVGSTRPASYASWALYAAGEAPYTLSRAGNGFCDPGVVLRPNDPRAVYDAFYEERNFSARAGEVKAAVLYTQGFEDSNVKSALAPDWFNAITAPKLGLFGHWVHQHPTRADNEVLMLGWMDQHVKGKALGFEKLAAAHVVVDRETQRAAPAWPPLVAETFSFGADLDGASLVAGAEGAGGATLLLDSVETAGGMLPLAPGDLLPFDALLTLDGAPLAAPVHLAGQAHVAVTGALRNAENGHLAAYLYEDDGNGTRLVTWGMFNLAHRNGHDRYEPAGPGETLQVAIPLLPTEWVFREGVKLHLELRGARVLDWAATPPTEPALFDLDGAGTALVLPLADTPTVPLAATAQR